MNNIRGTIGYADKSLNPYPGCYGPGGTATKPNHCPYCFARRIAERFRGTKAWPNGFDPTPRLDRLDGLDKLKKPYKIFMGDAGDLLGDWVPSADIRYILRGIQILNRYRHTYLFLTKNPQRLREFSPWPSNCWVGATVTDNRMFQEAFDAMAHLNARVRFLSFEPLLGPILFRHNMLYVFNWIILGGLAEPGGRVSYPHPDHVAEIEAEADRLGIPIWEKSNLNARLPGLLRQEHPIERRRG